MSMGNANRIIARSAAGNNVTGTYTSGTRRAAIATILAALLVLTLEAQIPNPIQAAKDALNKAKQQTKATPASPAGSPAANNNGAIRVFDYLL
jgi:hypothetical protein